MGAVDQQGAKLAMRHDRSRDAISRDRKVVLALAGEVAAVTFRDNIYSTTAVMSHDAVRRVPAPASHEVEDIPAPIERSRLDDAIRVYLSGKSQQEAARVVGISVAPLRKELGRRGLVRTEALPSRKRIPVDGAVEDYLRGESVLELSQRLGVSRCVIDRHLTEAGVSKRTASEQSFIAARKQTPAERKARASAANAAKRGRPNSPAMKAAAARTRQLKAAPESEGEVAMLGWLRERGEDPCIQTAVGKYNVDFTIAGIAVEVLGGEWHANKTAHAVRTKDILDAGWHVLFVWDTAHYPIRAAAADYAVAFAKESRVDPSAGREYRVIRGDGEFVASGSLENYDLTLIPPARSGLTRSEVGRLGCAARWGKRAA